MARRELIKIKSVALHVILAGHVLEPARDSRLYGEARGLLEQSGPLVDPFVPGWRMALGLRFLDEPESKSNLFVVP